MFLLSSQWLHYYLLCTQGTFQVLRRLFLAVEVFRTMARIASNGDKSGSILANSREKLVSFEYHDVVFALQWHHNGRDSVSNHQPHHCLLSRLFRCKSKKTSKSASLAFVRGIRRWPVNFLHKCPVTQKMFPFDDVIMQYKKSHYNIATVSTYPPLWEILHW